MPKSVVWILFNSKCSGSGGWCRGAEGRERKGRERKRVTRDRLGRKYHHSMFPMVSHWSCSSALLSGERPTKYSIRWVNLCSGGNAQIPSLGERAGCMFDRVSCSRLWISWITWTMCSAVGQGLSNESGSPLRIFDGWWHPSAAPHLSVAFPGWGGIDTWAGLFEGGGVTPWEQSPPHTPKLCRGCGQSCPQLRALRAVASPPRTSRDEFQHSCLCSAFSWIHSLPSAPFTPP